LWWLRRVSGEGLVVVVGTIKSDVSHKVTDLANKARRKATARKEVSVAPPTT
jgi:uncharacterized metal-binding protein